MALQGRLLGNDSFAEWSGEAVHAWNERHFTGEQVQYLLDEIARLDAEVERLHVENAELYIDLGEAGEENLYVREAARKLGLEIPPAPEIEVGT